MVPDERIPNPRELVDRIGRPDTVEGWQALAGGLLSIECCAFHRNVEISSRYAWIYKLQPACFKWAAMAAVASNHVRLALFPFRLDTDGTGYVDISRSQRRNKLLLLEDVNTIRETNNAIFHDIFWVHLAYATADNGIEHLRDLLKTDRQHAAILSGFETMDLGRRVLQDATAPAKTRQTATDLIWAGNLQLLEHEQRAMVQPNFDRLSGAFAMLISLGSATSFDVRGVRQRVGYFTSFYSYSLVRGSASLSGAHAWPRITRFEDRWRWLEGSVVPRFRRLDDDTRLLDAGLQHIADEARVYTSMPCLIPRSIQTPAGEPTLGWVVADCRAHSSARDPVPERGGSNSPQVEPSQVTGPDA